MSHLLVVDDNQAVLRVLSRILGSRGHTIILTHDGNEALGLIDKTDFDLVLTDLMMPNVSGWTIAQKVKIKDPNIPVILLTGSALGHDDEDLVEKGIDLLLPKPVDAETLTKSVEQLIAALARN